MLIAIPYLYRTIYFDRRYFLRYLFPCLSISDSFHLSIFVILFYNFLMGDNNSCDRLYTVHMRWIYKLSIGAIA